MEFGSKILSNKLNFFSGYSLIEVRDWYFDLANKISHLSGIQSTASKLLEYYLSPNNQKRDKKIINFCKNEIEGSVNKKGCPNYFGKYTNDQAGTFDEISELYLKKIKEYTEYKNEMKNMLNIFLSRKYKTKGIKRHILEDQENNKGIQKEYELTYYKSLGFSESDKLLYLLPLASSLKSDSKLSQSDKDRLDIYVGLNTFAVMAKIVIIINDIHFYKIESTETLTQNKIKSVTVSIKYWKNILFDYYDFNKDIGFPLPNPHYKNGKIHPEKENVSYSQTHEKLVEMTECAPPLANPFYVYKEFFEEDSELLVQNEEIEF